MLSPRTTFVGGNNPFAGLYARPAPTLQLDSPIMQTPAKPARKNAKRLKDEDYSTPYQPPIAKTVEKTASHQQHIDSTGLVICNDPLPAGRFLGVGKYDALFQQLGRGQAIKCPPDAVASVQHALRKWVKVQNVRGVLIKTCKDYGDGLGRVWLLAEPG